MSTRANQKKGQKRNRPENENYKILDGLTITKNGQYVKVDDILLKKLKQNNQTNIPLTDKDIMDKLKNLYSDCPEYADTLNTNNRISESVMNKINKVTKDTKKMSEMVGTIPLDWLALKRSTTQNLNYEYRYKTDVQPRVTDQHQSGRCWMFAGLNQLRYDFIQKMSLETKFEFSEAYLFFYDKLERSNVFLEGVWNLRDRDLDDRYMKVLTSPECHTVQDGGYWIYFKNLVMKYGLVPKSVYQDGVSCFSSESMNKTLINFLNHTALEIKNLPERTTKKSFDKLKVKYLKTVYNLLVRFMGEPPKNFDWRYKNALHEYQEIKNLTPLKFFKVLVPHSLDTKLTFIHDPSHPENYFKTHHVEYGCSMIGGETATFINLPLETFKRAVAESLINKDPVWFACDVGNNMDPESCIMDTNLFDYKSVLGINLVHDKKEMMKAWTSLNSHAMVINGVDMDIPNNDKEYTYRKWRVFNSWGKNSNDPENLPDEGCWQMSDEWFDQFVYMAVIDLKYFEFDPTVLSKIIENKNDKIIVRPWSFFGVVASGAGCGHCKSNKKVSKNKR